VKELLVLVGKDRLMSGDSLGIEVLQEFAHRRLSTRRLQAAGPEELNPEEYRLDSGPHSVNNNLG